MNDIYYKQNYTTQCKSIPNQFYVIVDETKPESLVIGLSMSFANRTAGCYTDI